MPSILALNLKYMISNSYSSYCGESELCLIKIPIGIRPQFRLLEKKYPYDCAHRNGHGAI